MITSNVKEQIRELSELDNRELEAACALFIRAALMVAIENDPRITSGDGSGHAGKPGSRGPGHQQCAGAVKRICSLAQSAYTKAVEVREHAESATTHMGGVDIRIPAAGPSVKRRRSGADAATVTAKLRDAVSEGAL